jgi:hypothetical protein
MGHHHGVCTVVGSAGIFISSSIPKLRMNRTRVVSSSCTRNADMGGEAKNVFVTELIPLIYYSSQFDVGELHSI